MQTFFRAGTLEPEKTGSGAAGAASVTVRLSFASEKPVLRRFEKTGRQYWEILSHGPGDVNLGLLNTEGIVLQDHEETHQIGTVIKGSAKVESDRKTRALIEITDPYWVERIEQGARPPVSVGYSPLSVVREEAGADGIPVLYCSWQPSEISILTERPADNSVGLYRSYIKLMRSAKPTLEELLGIALSGAREERSGGRLTREIVEEYSLLQLLREGREGTIPGGLVRELHEACPAVHRNRISGVYVPFECLTPLRRDMQATSFSAGGAFIQADMQSGPVELLKNHVAAITLGAEVISGLQGNFVAPQFLSGVTPQTLSEIAAATLSQMNMGQSGLVPIRVPVQINLSKQFVLQSGPAAEQAVRREIREQISVFLDRLILFGQGFNDEPLGIANTVGVGSVMYGGAPTWAKVLESEASLSVSNADIGSLGWALSPSSRNKWKQTLRAGANSDSFIMEGGRVNDYPALATNQLSDQHRSFFGNWADLQILIWGEGLDFVFDPITSAKTGGAILTAGIYFNVFVRHAQSFCVSADAANQ